MLSILKSPWASLAIVLAVATTTSVLATPFTALDDAPSLWDRAHGTRYVGSLCSSNSDCYSGNCQYSNERFTKICQRQPAGGPCFENNNCLSRTCTAGVCAVSPVNGPCNEVNVNDCADGSVCSKGTCLPRGSGNTLYPQDSCSTDSQCKSARCVSDLPVTDQYDVESPATAGQRCDYFAVGEGTCRTFVDCADGLCTNGLCNYGPDGSRCLYSAQCIGTCGADGVCFTPQLNSVEVGQPCRTDQNCFTNSCQEGTISRPLPDSPDTKHTVKDKVCFPGATCKADSDCENSACRNGACVILQLGQTCSSGEQCFTGTCDVNTSSSSKAKVCILSPALVSCEQDNQCFTNQCSTQECPGNTTGECGSNLGCQAQTVLGSCRTTADCDTTQAVCGADKKCRNTQGSSCSSNDQCVTGKCSNRKCVAAASTTKATTTSKATTTKASTTTSKATTTA
ncbi:hypothetical protein CF327_g1760 [Tilletia walkeri]|uniref:Uncharacterized protein n=1 Tax=Tilletia walkeri TaxID=117179 RepID=A0A8X7NCP1_9BASI|nr:hypothetical protein CF327_g1760 [Tilletia walkeri]KAE8270608.1 hypothetical protein A4X09_0g1711 [Tilletia walkeri]